MNILKPILLVFGCICLALGTLGAFLPVLPTVPFYLLATLCFAKSSERLHRWFTGTAIYKKNLESYVKGEGMTWGTKFRITVTITLSMALGVYFVDHLPIVQMVLGVIWLGLMVYFFAFVKTRPTAE